MKTVQELATKVRKTFVRKERTNGNYFWAQKTISNDWVQDMCREAHGEMGPNDYTYEYIVQALDSLSETDDEDEALEMLRDADIYNADLLTYLASHPNRVERVNFAVKEYGIDSENFDLIQTIQYAQMEEKREVFHSILNSLKEKRHK